MLERWSETGPSYRALYYEAIPGAFPSAKKSSSHSRTASSIYLSRTPDALRRVSRFHAMRGFQTSSSGLNVRRKATATIIRNACLSPTRGDTRPRPLAPRAITRPRRRPSTQGVPPKTFPCAQILPPVPHAFTVHPRETGSIMPGVRRALTTAVPTLHRHQNVPFRFVLSDSTPPCSSNHPSVAGSHSRDRRTPGSRGPTPQQGP